MFGESRSGRGGPDGDGDVKDLGTSTHTTRKTYATGETDVPKTGSTKKFDGSEIETLDYPHGTKVKLTKSGERITVEITYADGTSDTLTIPAP